MATYSSLRPGKLSSIDTPESFVFDQAVTQLYIKSFGEASVIYDLQSQAKKPFPLCGNYAYLAGNNAHGICSKGNEAILFDLETGEKIKSVNTDINLEDWNSVLELSPDSHYLAIGDKNNISVLDVSTEQVVKKLSFTSFDTLVAGVVQIKGSEKYVAAVQNPLGQISLIGLPSGEVIDTFSLDCCEIRGFAFAPDRNTVAILSEKILSLWDLSTQKIIYEEQLDNDYFGEIAFSPDGSKIYFINIENEIQEIELQTKEIKEIGRSYLRNSDYHFNNLGNRIQLIYEPWKQDHYNPIFIDTKTKQKIILPYEAIADSEFLEAYTFNPNNDLIVFGNADGIFVWDANTQKQIMHLDKHEIRTGDGWIGAIKSLMFSPQSNLLASVGWDGTTRLWNITTGNEIRRLNVCCSASFTPDGCYLVTAGDGVIRVWGIP